MIRPNQAIVIAFLGSTTAYDPVPDRVDRLETHGALVFLAGDVVVKIKKAVRFDYMNFSTLELRRRACLREFEINRPHAPEIYLDVVPITCDDNNRLQISGPGEPVDWAVRMRRFPQSDLLSSIADKGALGTRLCRQLADAIIAYHHTSPIVAGVDSATNLGKIATGIVVEMSRHRSRFSAGSIREFSPRTKLLIERLKPLLTGRSRNGYVRRCHGDLHLGNIVLWKSAPVLFDAIEFDEAIATIDTLYDLAFLVMDLDHRGQRQGANLVLNRYLWATPDVRQFEALAAMPLFLALRAGVRAMVSTQRADQEHGVARDTDLIRASDFFAHALAYLEAPKPLLVAVGGLSGTGKSTLAASLAPMVGPAPGAVHLRSDLERKTLFERAELDRLPAEAYTAEIGAKVYSTLLDKAAVVLQAGHGVVVDAVFATPHERAAIEQLAQRQGIPFLGIWLEAPPAVLRDRVLQRRDDASDATVEVVDKQLARDTGSINWRRVAADGSHEASMQQAIKHIPEACRVEK
jgi:uncharacterized protein